MSAEALVENNNSLRKWVTLFGIGSMATLFASDVVTSKTIYKEADFEHLKFIGNTQGLGKLVIVFAGFGNRNGKSRAEGVVKATNSGVDTTYVQYPQTGIEIERTLDAITDSVRETEPEQVMLYGHSNGGKIANKHGDELKERLDSLNNPPQSVTLALDCTPFYLDETSAPASVVSWLVKTPYSGGLLAKIAATYASELIDHGKQTHVHKPVISLLEKAWNDPSNALLISQLRYLAEPPIVSHAFDSVSYLRPADPNSDQVVRTNSAVVNWAQIYPDLQDYKLEGSHHASIADDPTAYSEALDQSWA